MHYTTAVSLEISDEPKFCILAIVKQLRALGPKGRFMQRLAQLFPTFSIGKNTDREIGKRLLAMGYQYKRHAKGLSYQMEEMPS